VGYSYLLSHLAKQLIKQAESEVSANDAAAFPLARLVVALLLRGHAAFGEMLFSRLVKKCPWVIPYCPPRLPNQPRDEWEKSIGRLAETLPEYIGRMSGIASLYFAILQTSLSGISRMSQPPTPQQLLILVIPQFRLPAAWTWLSNALRDPMPAQSPTAHLLTAWMEIAGAEALRVFGPKQLGKVFEVILSEGLAEGGKIKGDSEAARQRLGIVLKEWRTLKYHEGREEDDS
jgi:nucleoporin GLE1